MTHLTIYPGTIDDAARTAGLIASAFEPLDVARWLVPDPADRVRVLAGQFTIFVEDALKQGEVLLAGYRTHAAGRGAAAVCYQPTRPLTPPDDYDARLAQTCGPYVDRFRRLDDLLANHHPTGYPHHHLFYLATLPEHQGHGLGTALLGHILHRLDHAEVPAFLVASNERTRDMYTRHGYEQIGDPLRLPEGPTMWPMRREPQDPTRFATVPETGTRSVTPERRIDDG